MTFADVLHDFFIVVQIASILYFALANSFYGITMILATREVRRAIVESTNEDSYLLLGTRMSPTITVLAPAYNEAGTIEESIRSLLGLHYPELEIIVVNDGSKDETLDVLRDRFDLIPEPRLYEPDIPTKAVRGVYRSRTNPDMLVVDKENGGKADALNAALNLARGTLVCAIDADTIITPDALLRMVRPFLRDPKLLAAGGTLRIVNACVVREGWVRESHVSRRPLPGIQTVEYLRAFLFGRMGLNPIGGNLVISGAFGLFRRDAVLNTGGYAHDSIGEDMELVMRLRRAGKETNGPDRVISIPDPVAWTEVPSDLRTLGKQRARWHQGLGESLSRHKRMFMNPRYGLMGTVIMPYFTIVELLAPVIELIGIASILIGHFVSNVSLVWALWFFLFAYAYGLFLTLMTILLDELTFRMYPRIRDRALLLLWATAEYLGYRQLTVYWRLKGLIRWMTGTGSWGEMKRAGFKSSTEEPQVV